MGDFLFPLAKGARGMFLRIAFLVSEPYEWNIPLPPLHKGEAF